MNTTTNDGSPFGPLGVFLAMLGAGLVLDADWWWPGGALMAAGLWCFWKEHDRHGARGADPR